MNSINFVLLGDQSLAAQLGKKGTATDIAIYDRKSPEAVFTWTVPSMFPEKIQSLVQAINIAEYAILNATTLDKFLGEQIVALDAAGMTEGFVLHSYAVDREKLKSMLRNTALSNYRFVESVDELKTEMGKLAPRGTEGPAIIAVDHAFDVKGVGTVILGVVRQGKINVYDELFLLPSLKQVLIKSIQMHDDPVQSSSSPARVGLAVKGASADEISRGDIICGRDTLKVSGESLNVKFTKSPFFKGEVSESQMYMISVGMQIRPAKIKLVQEGSLQVALEKPIAYKEGQGCILLKPDSQSTRVIGRGVLQ